MNGKKIKNKIKEIVDNSIVDNKKSNEYKELMTLIINFLDNSINKKLEYVNIKSEPTIKKVDYFIGRESVEKYIKEFENEYKQTVFIYNNKKSIPLFTWEITNNVGVIISEDNAFTFCATDDEILFALKKIMSCNSKFWIAIKALK